MKKFYSLLGIIVFVLFLVILYISYNNCTKDITSSQKNIITKFAKQDMQKNNYIDSKKEEINKNPTQNNIQNIEGDYIPPISVDDIPKVEKLSIDILDYRFTSENELSFKDITIEEDQIMNWINEFVNSLWMIRYSVFSDRYWYTKKMILIQWDRKDLVYSFFVKWDKLYGARKSTYEYNPPKWADYSKLEAEKNVDCYASLNNCRKDILFLFDYIQKLKIDK